MGMLSFIFPHLLPHTIVFTVPFVMRRLEATNARKVVLFRVQSKEDWWSNNWKEREEEISLIPYHHESM